MNFSIFSWKWSRRTAVMMLGASALLSACVDPQSMEPAASTSEALWSTSRGGSLPTYWPNALIQICFEPGPGYTTSSPGYISRINAAQTIIEQEFEGIADANISFTGWDTCPSEEAPGTVRFTINNTPGLAGANFSGYSATQQSHMVFSSSYGVGAGWDTVVLHELAHVLGFDHELRRAEGNTVWTDGTGCHSGLNGIDGDPDDPWPGTRLTRYDADSITNGTYCHANGRLSPLDRLGAAIVYPASYTHPIRLTGGNPIVSGDGYIVRSDDPGALVPDWTARGAHADAYGLRPYWTFAGTSLFTENNTLSFPASSLPEDSGTVSAVYLDFRHRLHTLEHTKVIVNDGLHTAITIAVL